MTISQGRSQKPAVVLRRFFQLMGVDKAVTRPSAAMSCTGYHGGWLCDCRDGGENGWPVQKDLWRMFIFAWELLFMADVDLLYELRVATREYLTTSTKIL